MKPFIDAMDNKYRWCIAAVPGEKWAKKVFPGMRTSQAVEKLWEAILKCARAEEGSDPAENWKRHNESFVARCEYLNSLGIKELKYKSENGTDFTVGLIPDGIFMGGGEYSLLGDFYNPNIPTEEIFTSPMRGKADGIVYATKPLSYRGELITNFSVRFEDGKAVEVHAEKGEELLNQMIAMDEGASYLGECAIVPYSSPINKSGILFYNTLFDENAACHLALGEGFANCLKDFDKYTLEQCREKGINESMIHEDFMIGNESLCIEGICEDGSSVTILKNGEWAI
jgi:aminopeptidase